MDVLDLNNNNINYNQKNIIIYSFNFDYTCGGITVLYYLASLLDKLGYNVRVKAPATENHIFNKFYNNDFDLNKTIVIYPEVIEGNPLNAPHVIRWILAEVGINIINNVIDSWGKNDLVYYFNCENKFYNSPEKIGSIYKLLTVIYINPNIKNNNTEKRDGYCFTLRKHRIHKNINYIHPNDSFYMTPKHTQDDYIEIFNKYKYFISYDPLTFLTIIASLCGCISIVYPIEGVSKKEWLEKTAISEYLKNNNEELYGIAYGNSPDEIDFAEKTIHLVQKQWNNIKNYEQELFTNFIKDINNFDNMNNTIQNNYY